MTIEDQFIIELSKALHVNGVPAHRLEDTMQRISNKLNVSVDFYTTPSSIFISFSHENGDRTILKKVSGGDLNFEALEEIDKITKLLLAGEIDCLEGLSKLKDANKLPNRNGWIKILFFAISTSSAARLFGGGYAEIIVAGIIGLVIGVMIELIVYLPSLSRVLVLIASILAIVISKFAVTIFGDYAVDIAIITGLIILIPGFSFTQAVTELASGHTISGTSRLASTIVTFTMIAFGVGIGNQLMIFAAVQPASFQFSEIPFWTQFIALITVPAGFVVLFKAVPKHFIWMFLACGISYYSLTFFSGYNLKELSVFFAALSLGIVCNLVSRITDKPVSLMLVPGIILLVPGSIGFKSVAFLVSDQTLSGIENAFSAMITAVALTVGLLFSNMLIKPKRSL